MCVILIGARAETPAAFDSPVEQDANSECQRSNHMKCVCEEHEHEQIKIASYYCKIVSMTGDV